MLLGQSHYPISRPLGTADVSVAAVSRPLGMLRICDVFLSNLLIYVANLLDSPSLNRHLYQGLAPIARVEWKLLLTLT